MATSASSINAAKVAKMMEDWISLGGGTLVKLHSVLLIQITDLDF